LSGGGATQSTNLAGSRTFGSVYQNTNAYSIMVQGYGQITGGSGDSSGNCQDGPSFSLGNTIMAWTYAYTVSGEATGFSCLIPPGYYYSINVVHNISGTPVAWYETSVN
jgi:hypothetical protein